MRIIMKLKRNVVTGICGILFGIILFIIACTSIKMPPNLVEPGPRLMPYVALILIVLSSAMILINGIKDRGEEEPYFPEGGIKKITIAYLELVAYGIGLTVFGFILATPFAMLAFIYTLKGEEKMNIWINIIISIAVTAFLYLMFVKGFQIKLPGGLFFD